MEKQSVVEKMNKDLQEFIAKLPKKEYKDGWAEDNWQEEMEKHPLFRTKPLDEGEEMPALVEALQQLKYDPSENTPEDLAMSYKEDGNSNFKLKKYRWAVDSYTKGIEAKCENNELNAQLYANRATSHYHIGNYKKALKDATESKKLKPDHLKAYQRGAMCCFQLHEFDDCISWCDEGLKVAPEDKSLLELKKKSEEEKKIMERNTRKAKAQEGKKKKDLEMVKQAIKERGITVDDDFENSIVHPLLTYAKVHLKDGRLVWPVLFMYPEYGTTDYIHEFHEDTSLIDHLNIMFKPEEPPQWDIKHEYYAENLQVYVLNPFSCIIPVEVTQTLKEIFSSKNLLIRQGTPCFTVTVRGSKFDESYRKKNVVLEK